MTLRHPTWLYGPRVFRPGGFHANLRALTVDLETVVDALETFEKWAIPQVRAASGLSARVTRYAQTRGKEFPVVTVESLTPLSTPDRDLLELTSEVAGVSVEGNELGGSLKLRIVSSQGSVFVDGMSSASSPDLSIVARSLEQQVIDYLYEHATVRLDLMHVRWMTPLLPLVVAFVAWIVVAVSVPLAVPVHVLILALIALATYPAYKAARELASGNQWRAHPFQYRGESRSETYRRRADEKRDLSVRFKTALITAPIAIVVGLLGGLGFSEISPVPTPSHTSTVEPAAPPTQPPR